MASGDAGLDPGRDQRWPDDMLARIGIMRALYAGRPAPEPAARRKAIKKHGIVR
jgi:hypothetical protein